MHMQRYLMPGRDKKGRLEKKELPEWHDFSFQERRISWEYILYLQWKIENNEKFTSIWEEKTVPQGALTYFHMISTHNRKPGSLEEETKNILMHCTYSVLDVSWQNFELDTITILQLIIP